MTAGQVHTVVVIPTLAEVATLWPLLDVLSREPDTTVIVEDNGMCPEAMVCLARYAERNVGPVLASGLGLYAMWNDGARLGLEGTDPARMNLAFLNDDIVVLPGTVAALSAALRSDEAIWAVSADYRRPCSLGLDPAPPELVHGTYRQGGIAGWCFMVRGDRWPGVDERFGWWYGDDDVVCAIEEAGGKVAIAAGVPVDHLGEATAVNHPWTHEAKVADAALFREKWGNR